MRIRINTRTSLLLLALVLLVWAGVGYFLYAIASGQSARASDAFSRETEGLEHESALRLHTFARETKDERERLEGIADPEIIEILDAVEGAGRDAGVGVTVGRALKTGVGKGKAASDIHSAVLAIEAEGTFGQLSRLLALLETLAIPSEVKEVHFEKQVGTTVEGPWRVVIEVQFLTTAEISS